MRFSRERFSQILTIVLAFPMTSAAVDAKKTQNQSSDQTLENAILRFGSSRFRSFGETAYCAFSHDGKTIAVGSVAGEVHFWSRSGTLIRSLPKEFISAVEFSPDDRLAVLRHLGSRSSMITVCALTDEKKILKLYNGKEVAVKAVVFSQASDSILAVYEDAMVVRFNIKEEKRTSKLVLPNIASLIRHAVISSDNQSIAFAINEGEKDSIVQIYDLEDQKIKFEAKIPTQNISQLIFSQNKNFLACVGDESVRVWDLSKKTPSVLDIPKTNDTIGAVAFSSDQKHLQIGEWDGLIHTYDLTKQKRMKSFRGHPFGALCIACSCDDAIAVGGFDNLLRLYDFNSGKAMSFQDDGHTATIWAVDFARLHNCVVSASGDETVRFWEIDTGKEVRRIQLKECTIRILKVTSTGKYIIGTDQHEKLYVWSADPADKQEKCFTIDGVNPIVDICDVNNDKEICIVTKDRVIIKDLSTGTTIAHHELKDINMRIFAYNAQSGLMGLHTPLELNKPAQLYLYNRRQNPTEFKALERADELVGRTTFSLDGRFLLSTNCLNGISTIRESFSGKVVCVIKVPEISRGLIDVRNGYAVFGTYEGKVAIYDFFTGRTVQSFSAHSTSVSSLNLVDNRLLTGSSDCTMLLWKYSTVFDSMKRYPTIEAADLQNSWDKIGGDPSQAYPALRRLWESPKTDVLSYLERRFNERKHPDEKTIESHIADLSSPRFPVRETAKKELTRLGVMAVTNLEKRLAQEKDPEAAEAISKLLAESEISRDISRHIRLIYTLEMIGSASKYKDRVQLILKNLVGTNMPMCITNEAKATLERLKRDAPK